jgi:hypothetical protein
MDGARATGTLCRLQRNSQSFPAVSLSGVWQTTLKWPLQKKSALSQLFQLVTMSMATSFPTTP